MITEKFIEVVLPLPIDKPFHYRIPKYLENRDFTRVRVTVPFGRKNLTGYSIKAVETPGFPQIKDIHSIVDENRIVTDELLELAGWMSRNYVCSLGEALNAIFPVSLLPPKRFEAQPRAAEGVPGAVISSSAWPALKVHQAAALDRISEALETNAGESFLLHGVTSSGKTEVYLSAIKKALEKGRSAIFLLPEISLTPQFIDIIQSRFPGVVGIWHSKLTKTQRYDIWRKALDGRVKIMLGARSAIFAPFKRLGIIVVDEEHEPSYKQETRPAYQTRDLALKRAKLSKAVLILGSATPSLESFTMSKAGEIKLLELPERIDGRPLPRVKLVDLKLKWARSKILSAELISAITKILAKREQAIIFLNRRGFSPGIMCAQCSEVWQCPSCSVSLVYHKHDTRLACHYCNHTQAWPAKCPSCGSDNVSIFGVGTQKVEEEIKRLFPQGRIFRLDRDTASKKGVYEKTYQDFKAEEFDILLGTQMIAKGFDFPRVTLVGVIDADTALYQPDFRSPERTFQLLTQVSGRCGRSELGGEVIIQTKRAEHYTLQAAKSHDYKVFYDQEIALRRQMGYPPFKRLANIKLRSKNEEKLKLAAEEISAKLIKYRQDQKKEFEILGPTPSARTKIQGMFRWQILLKGEIDALLDAVNACCESKTFGGAQITIDVDPQSTL
jgi:primosomal protein N' (replication factor Y) (superfamily II helicase)